MGKVFQQVSGAVRRLSPRTVLLLGFGLFLLYAFPGWMSTDSAVQLIEARAGRYSDAHPPLMSAMWRYLDMLVAGPVLMLLLQASVFLGGVYVILRRSLAPKAAAWVSIGILLFPPVMTVMGVIWKDSQMAAFLVAGVAGILQTRWRYRALGLVLLVLACALRHNALAAVIPIVLVLFRLPALALWQRIALVLAGLVFVVGAAFAVSKVLTTEHVKLTPVWQDIVGVIAYTRPMSDAELREILRGTPLIVEKDIQKRARRLTRLRGAWRITWGADRMFEQPTNLDWGPMNRAWRTLVFGDPVAYLKYHWHDYKYLLGIPYDSVAGTVWNLPLENKDQMNWIEHYAAWSRIQDLMAWPLYRIAVVTPLFKPWVYAVIGLLLLVLCCRDRLTFGLIASGILYELSYFPIGVNPELRYSHWMITAIVLATVILFIQRLRPRPT